MPYNSDECDLLSTEGCHWIYISRAPGRAECCEERGT
jgi:hypothetical protein